MEAQNEDTQISSYHRDWWDEPVHHKTRDSWKPGVERYFEFQGIPYTHEKFSLEFVKRVIPHIGVIDDRWKKFPKDCFDPHQYPAHKALHQAVEDEFERLLREHETAKKEAAEKKKADQQERESQDEAAANELQTSIALNRARRNTKNSTAGSHDGKSNSGSAQKTKKASSSAQPSQEIKVQGQISQLPSGDLTIQPSKSTLQIKWEQYKKSRKIYLEDKQIYEEERAQTKWLKTPTDSQDGN